MLILVAAVGSCDSDVPKEHLHTVFTRPLLGAEAPLQIACPGYGCPAVLIAPALKSCLAPSPSLAHLAASPLLFPMLLE